MGAGFGIRAGSWCRIFCSGIREEKHILIAAATDTSALGALDAVREAKREKHVAIVGQDAIPEALTEISGGARR